MAPAALKSKAYSSGVATQADDAKYRQKYGELKKKLVQVEEDNTKLAVKILRSKKAIQRLRIERAILYDRLQSTVAPTNPYALSSAAHLATLAASSSSSSASTSSSNVPPTILQIPSYPLADPQAPSLFLKQLDAQKLAAVQHGVATEMNLDFGAKPVEGIDGEAQKAREHERLIKAGGGGGGGGGTVAEPQPEAAQPATTGAGGFAGAAGGSTAAPTPSTGQKEPPAVAAAGLAQAVEVPAHAEAQPMQTDQQQQP